MKVDRKTDIASVRECKKDPMVRETPREKKT